MAKKKLPIYELRINPERGKMVKAISLVQQPAIEEDFQFFSSVDSDIQTFSFEDYKMRMTGPAMIPNEQIYRTKDPYGNECFVFFTEDTIEFIAKEFMKNGFQNNMNINHKKFLPANTYVYESFILSDKHKITGKQYPKGTWLITSQCEDKETFEKVKSGELRGFSVEGIFDWVETELAKQESDEEKALRLMNELYSIINKLK